MNRKVKNCKCKFPKVQSIIAQYIRGEKNLQDIVHPSKLTRIRCEQQQCSKSPAPPLPRYQQPKTPGKRKTNDSYATDPIVTLESDDGRHRDGGDSASLSAKPIRIDRVMNRIDSRAEQATATTVKTSSSVAEPVGQTTQVKSRDLRSRRLANADDIENPPIVTNTNILFDWDTRIRHEAIVTGSYCRGGGGSSFVANVSDQRDSSATSTSTSTSTSLSKSSEKLASSGESASSKLRDGSESRSAETTTRLSPSRYENKFAKTFASVSSGSSIVSSAGGGLKTFVDDDNDDDSKQLRADIRYFEEKIAQERAQIDDLTDEIGKARRVHDEYNAANQENAAANAAARIVSKKEFENALNEFLNASESWSSSANVSNVGLDFVITDYFTKCYDNLSKKVHQCDSQRKVSSILVDSLKKNRIRLQNRVDELKNNSSRDIVS